MENRHFKASTLDHCMEAVVSPVLVVGAGTGILVEHLNRKGHETSGLDLDPEMIRMARANRGLGLVQGDARALPFPDESFNTVIIASGVLDYLEDPDSIRATLDEALRVLRLQGTILAGFYQLDPVSEEVDRELGVIEGDVFHMDRLFRVQEMAESNPLAAIPTISRWTGKSRLRILLYWARLGLFLPRPLREDRARVARVVELAARDGLAKRALYDAVPGNIPYRSEKEIHALMQQAGLIHYHLSRFDDCIVLVHRKTLLTSLRKLRPEKTPATASDGRWLVRTEDLACRYRGAPRNAVEGVSLTVNKGEVFGILGPNGAGKTTTLALLCGLLKPASGRILFAEELALVESRRIIGYVPQDLAVNHKLTGRENLLFFGRLYGVTGRKLKARVEQLLAMIGLSDRGDDLVSQYSGGMVRRLNLAAGLVHEPKLLLLDEPTVGIDPQSRNAIFESVLELKRSGVTVFYTTHYMEEAFKLCDRIVIMDHGRVILEGDPREAVETYGLFTIEFSAAGPLEELVRRAAAFPSVVHAAARGGILAVATRTNRSSKQVIEQTFAAAESLGLELTLRRLVEPSLEGLFLDLTGRQLQDRGEAVLRAVEDRWR
jgi:ABC-2 type transport system ATP-binding protein